MKRRGFTLIELLVVIAIIGILAAMLFPVFARARESARKVQCLANVKNIAMAMNMYGADWDAFPPGETRQEVIDYFSANGLGIYNARYRSNPYNEPPVVLDEYIKNRSIWNCPSAIGYSVPTLIFGDPDWFGELVARYDDMPAGDNGWALGYPYPSGWGGDVTDSFIQGKLPAEIARHGRALNSKEGSRVFTQSIGFNIADDRHSYKLAAIEDTSTYIVCGDNGLTPHSMNLSQTAFPDMCHADCAGYYGIVSAPATDPVQECDWHWYYDQKEMKAHGSRHLGGVNVGFLDGHASWYDSMALVKKYGEVCTAEPNCNPCPPDIGDVWGATSFGLGIGMWGPSSKFPITWSCCDDAFVTLDQPWPPMLF